jgi:transcriptional regulator with XRE-family HTH domain
MTDPPGSRLRAAREAKRYSQKGLADELRRVAAARGHNLPDHASLTVLISRWENGHHTPDQLYRELLPLALDQPAAQLGLDPGPPAPAPAGPGTLIAEDDHATLTYDDGLYHLKMRRTLHNTSPHVVVRYLVRIAVDKYPGDAE